MIVGHFRFTHPLPCLALGYIRLRWRIVCVVVSFDVDNEVL
jgi:hypothetical protein